MGDLYTSLQRDINKTTIPSFVYNVISCKSFRCKFLGPRKNHFIRCIVVGFIRNIPKWPCSLIMKRIVFVGGIYCVSTQHFLDSGGCVENMFLWVLWLILGFFGRWVVKIFIFTLDKLSCVFLVGINLHYVVKCLLKYLLIWRCSKLQKKKPKKVHGRWVDEYCFYRHLRIWGLFLLPLFVSIAQNEKKLSGNNDTYYSVLTKMFD